MSSPEIGREQLAQEQINALNLTPLDQELAERAYFSLGLINLQDLFSRSFLGKFLSRAKVGIHEAGHEVVGEKNGWNVLSTTVIERGRVLGATLLSPGAGRPYLQLLKEKARLSFGSLFSETIGGISDHSGTEGDHSVIYAVANEFAHWAGVSPQSFISEQRSLAASQASTRSRSWYINRGLYLASVGTAT